MESTQKEIIEKLQTVASILKRSPVKRDFSRSFYESCRLQFGTFNRAKQAARLSIFKRSCDPLPKSAYLYTSDLAKIASYITFDGISIKASKHFIFHLNIFIHLEILSRQYGISSV